MSRPYTGFDGISRTRRPGTEALVAEIQKITAGRLWNNGTLVIRSINGGSSPSVHSTGRAADLSHRPMGDHRAGTSRTEALQLVEQLIAGADLIGLEMVIDYVNPKRVWRCDRSSWLPNPRVSGVGDSFHIEISPEFADDPGAALDGIRKILTPTASPSPRYPGRPLKLGSRGVSVARVQERLTELGYNAGPVDGRFGPVTDRAVRAFQTIEAPPVDGIVGPITWSALWP
jgi:hypothetical protein